MPSYLKYVYALLCAILMFSTFQISSGRSLSANNATEVNNLGAPMSMLNESAAILNNALSNDQFYEANATELNGYKQESWVPTNVILTDAGTTVTEIDQNDLKNNSVVESDILDPMFSVNITRNNESTVETTTEDATTEVETSGEQDVETTPTVVPIQSNEHVIPMIECLNLALDIESIFSIQNPLYKRNINTNPFTRSMDPNYASQTQILESLSGIIEKLEYLAEKAHRCDVREKKYNEPFIKGLSRELEEALIDMAEYMRSNKGKSDFENVIAYFKTKNNILTLNYANRDYKNGKESKNEECVCEESDSKKNLAGNE